jgi:hypothetical protein
VTIDEDIAERAQRRAELILLGVARCPIPDVGLAHVIAVQLVLLEDEIRALRDEVRLAASGGRERA